MTKSQLVDSLQTRTGLTRKRSADAVEALLDTVQDVLGRRGEVAPAGFGRFGVSERGARAGKRPRTGEPMQIGATRGARLAPAAGLQQGARP